MIASQHGNERTLPEDDYQWFVDDKSWVEASDGKLRWNDLARLKSLLFDVFAEEEQWVDFLKSDGRLSHLLQLAHLPEEYINYEFYRFDWGDVCGEGMAWEGIGSNYWSDPTPFELMVCETVKTLYSNWWVKERQNCCWEDLEFVHNRYQELEEYVKMHEKQQFRVKPYFSTDYHLYETDDEWVSTSPKLLRTHYLDVLKKSVDESSWLGFLKRPDRLQRIIRWGDPRLEQGSILEGGVYKWEDLASPIWGLGSKVWPDPTPYEIAQVKELFTTFQVWDDAADKLRLLLETSHWSKSSR